ncbi:type II and III secretion system protein [Tenacibaculum maritimum]|uniref:type II secretion system protein GspD n=5 Tax=Tenacibaculum maritimum TaxID=107401 RepID=UPI0012E635AE|nr:type II and III secretion system protein [Tenacibaculum maritimum]MCD9583747.1 type II and III secretion system protein [Tenacibaculum maritimum]MCD9610969.1 type II and III secretion system protein [Tenacibaculum maritimum]MCD9619475.1 type II and III secretion system protein [Tenacibaculum maritimum]MCD9626183.1 type II and III secretion system protein [Tenacibaculum maritimum]MCD9629175.1 type II and III secretion system protein [Tenacibaculum maritimum]
MKKDILIVVLFIGISVFSQGRRELKEKLEELSKVEKGLNELVQINVSQISLYDFVTTLSNEHKINVSVDESLDQSVINNFYNVKVKDVFLFLVKKYDLEIQFLNRIMILSKKKIVKEKKLKKIDISYDAKKELLSLNLIKDTLFLVTKKIAYQTGKNIILSPEIKNRRITNYILKKPIDLTLSMLSRANGLEVIKEDNGYYYIKERAKKRLKQHVLRENNGNKINRKNDNLYIKINSNGTLDIKADEVAVADIIYNMALKSGQSYFLYSRIGPGLKSSFAMQEVGFKGVLEHLLKGTKYTFREENGCFLIGEKNKEGLHTTELIRMRNRTIENVLESIPSRITAELEVKEFSELNGIVVTGHISAIRELKSFLKQIDKNVPVVQIEVIIFQYEKSYELQTGLKAGFDKAQASSIKNAFPTTDVTFNSSKLNKLIDAFNGLGIVNLGKVPQNFYLGLKALENNAVIKLESTPKIATLNGHEANFKIGSTDYYFEQTNRILTGGVRKDILQSGQWRPTEANLSLKIKPFVSKDENVTLNISVEKSAFTGRVGETAPPSKTTQQFESLIRVKNGEMILLGGLDEAEKNNSGTGTPFLSRIPIIKWFFSGRKKKKKKTKLHMFIKPTIFY